MSIYLVGRFRSCHLECQAFVRGNQGIVGCVSFILYLNKLKESVCLFHMGINRDNSKEWGKNFPIHLYFRQAH